MDNEKNKNRDKKKLIGILLILVIAILTLLMFSCSKGEDKTAWLSKRLATDSDKVVEINEDIIITEPITVNGAKTISGEGRIVYRPASSQKLRLTSYMIPDGACQAVEIADLSETEAMFVVADGASLTIGGTVTLDGNGKALDVKVEKNGALNITETSVLENGKGANIYSDGEIVVSGGKVVAKNGYNIMTNGTMSVTGGEISGSAKQLMGIVSNGTLDISGGTITGALGTNVYVTDGTVSVSGGTISGAGIDNVYVEAGEIDVTGGKVESGKHGLHNAGEINLTGGELANNINNFYNEGVATVTDYSFGNSQGHNVINTGSNANMVMTGSEVTNATTHALYNVLGAKLELSDFTVKNALAKGIHNGGGFLNGKDITIVRAGGAGVGNEKEKGCAVEGVVNIDNLKVLKAKNFNLLNSGGEMTVTNATLGVITTHSIQVSDGTLNLKDVEMEGTTGTSTAHGFYLMGGVINAENVTLAKSASRGIQNRGGEFYGKNITITDVNGTGIGQMTGVDAISESTTVIDNLEMKDILGYALQNTNKGTMKISNAKVEITNNTAVRCDDGSMTINNATFTGVKTDKEPDSQYGGFSLRGGVVTLNNIKVTNVLGRGISNEGSKLTGKNIVINGVEGTGICTEKTGVTNIDTVTLSNIKGYDVDVKASSATFTNATFNISRTTSCTHVKAGTLTINNSVMNGAPEIVKADGTIGKYHGVTVDGGTAILNNVTIKDTAGNGIRNSAGTVKGKNVVLENCAKSLATRLYNAEGHEMYIDGLEITGAPQSAYNIDNRGTMTLKNAKICEAGTTNLHLQGKAVTNLENATFAGTTVGHAIFVKGENVVLNMDTVTINNTGYEQEGRAISNGGNSAGKFYEGGRITGKNVVVDGVNVSSGITNETGTMTFDGLTIKNVNGGYDMDVKAGSVTVKNGTFYPSSSASSFHITGDSKATLESTVFEGTNKGHTIAVKGEDVVLNLNKVTLLNSGKEVATKAISNGGTFSGKFYEGGTINAKDVLVNGTNGTGIANESGTMNIDGLEVLNAKGHDMQVVKGTVHIKNATFHESLIEAQSFRVTNGKVTIEDSLFDGAPLFGTSKYQGLIMTNGEVVLNNTTFTKTAGNAIRKEGGTLTGKNIILDNAATAGATGFDNISGTVDIDGLTMSGHSGYGFNNQGTATLKNVVVKDSSKAVAINNTKGTLTIENANINTKSAHACIRALAGTVNLEGTFNLATTGKYALYLDSASEKEVVLKAGTKILADKAFYMQDNALIVEGMLGNATTEKIYLAPTSATRGTVYVDTPSAEIAKAISDAKIFLHFEDATDIVVGEGENSDKLVAVPVVYDTQVQTINVSTWAELKNAIEGAKKGANLSIVLQNDIEETAESMIIAGPVKVVLTDNGAGYKITRTDLTKALFDVSSQAMMTIDGKITIDGAATKDAAAEEAIILNQGTLTINSNVIVTGGYKSGSDNSLLGTGKSGGAIENIGILDIKGTVTASGSGNGTAVANLAGEINITNAKLNGNIGRALRVGAGTATITGSEFNNNTGANGGGSVLIDAADVTMTDSFVKNNASTGFGGGVQVVGATVLTMTNCEVSGNTAATNGGGFSISHASAEVTLTKCTVSNNKALNSTNKTKQGLGGGIYVNNNKSITIDNCKILANTTTKASFNASNTNPAGLGGGICIFTDGSGAITVTNTEFKNNTTDYRGGAMYIGGKGTHTITDCKFESNKSVLANGTLSNNGGAILIEKAGTTSISGSTFDGNQAGNGAAITNFCTKTVTISGCEFKNGVALNGAGAIYVENTTAVTEISNTTFTKNSAKDGGAIHAKKYKTLSLTGCTFTDNEATRNGNTIYDEPKKATYTETKVDGTTIEKGSNKY